MFRNMENTSIEELHNYCNINNIPEPKYKTKREHDFFITEVTIDNVIQEKGTSDTEMNAKNLVARMLLDKLKTSSLADLKEEYVAKAMKNISISDNQFNGNNNTNNNTNSAINSVLNTSPNTGNSEKTNYTGILQEFMQKKRFSPPKYSEHIKSGEDHCPEFTIKCNVNYNGCEIVGSGNGRTVKDAKKSSAESVYRQIRAIESNIGSKSPENNQMLIQYLSENFSNNSELNVYIEDNEKDYYKKLEKLAPIIGCNINSMVSNDGKKITLQLIITHISQILLTSYGSVDEGLEESKRLAAKKAVLMLKVLNTSDQ